MPTRTEYKPGTPSWVDVQTTDTAAAKAFYGSLFGWTFDDQTGDGGDVIYSIATLKGQPVAGLSAQQPGQIEMGAPPMWSTYVTVTDADATTALVEPAGGSVFMPPMDVMDAGRMSVLADPTGAVICTWQAKNHIGAGLVNETGAFCWNELVTPDVEKAAAFYKKIFGWGAETHESGPMRYTEWKLDGESVGGALPPPMEGIPPMWGVYFAVDDCDASVEAAKGKGATVMAEPMTIPQGRFAVLTDPQGAFFNVIALPA